MRATFNSHLVLNGDTFQGINLGADYCAEHEWGIKGLSKAFGLCSVDDYEKVVGIERYKATRVPNVVRMIQFQNRNVKYVSLLVSNRDYLDRYTDVELKKLVAYPLERTDTFTNAAWDENSFSITVPYTQRKYLIALKEAIEKTDIAIYMDFVSNPFARGGLCVMLFSQISDNVKNTMMEKHKNQNALLKAANDTGIAYILKTANKGWYALKPEWAENMKNHRKTAYPVIFYLNPEKQSEYNYGWFTVEELMMWAGDKGPVVKKKAGD